MTVQDVDARELEAMIERGSELLVMFAGSACEFSRDFEPHFRDTTVPNGVDRVHAILREDDDETYSKWRIEVTPTVAYFNRGEEKMRVEALPERGLEPRRHRQFMNDVAVRHAHRAA